MSAEMISKITDRIIPDIKEWQPRPLNPMYPFIFMDAVFSQLALMFDDRLAVYL